MRRFNLYNREKSAGLEPRKSVPHVVDSQEFDIGVTIAEAHVAERHAFFSKQLMDLGFSMDKDLGIFQYPDKLPLQERLSQLELMAQVLFAQWSRCRSERDKTGELAVARMFNAVTRTARETQSTNGVTLPHIERLQRNLAENVKKERVSGSFDLDECAQLVEVAAREHTHEAAWSWCVLPTFSKQHYGRILLAKVATHDNRFPLFVTQPFFLSGEATLSHTHGQNWAFSRPLGGSDSNTHINTMWLPHSPTKPFPLVEIDKKKYNNSEVVVIPPLAIHAISRSRDERRTTEPLPSIQELEKFPELFNKVQNVRFGEYACLHLYRPDWPLVESLASSPFVKDNEQFFMENDMIVFDHQANTIWAGGGGAWARRMVEFGTTGEHCGQCFTENDPRQENLDPQQVYSWLLQTPAPKVKAYVR